MEICSSRDSVLLHLDDFFVLQIFRSLVLTYLLELLEKGRMRCAGDYNRRSQDLNGPKQCSHIRAPIVEEVEPVDIFTHKILLLTHKLPVLHRICRCQHPNFRYLHHIPCQRRIFDFLFFFCWRGGQTKFHKNAPVLEDSKCKTKRSHQLRCTRVYYIFLQHSVNNSDFKIRSPARRSFWAHSLFKMNYEQLPTISRAVH